MKKLMLGLISFIGTVSSSNAQTLITNPKVGEYVYNEKTQSVLQIADTNLSVLKLDQNQCTLGAVKSYKDIYKRYATKEEIQCGCIEFKTDQFTGEKTYSSPSFITYGASKRQKLAPIQFIKIIKDKEVIYYAELSTGANTPPEGDDVIILFTDGSKIEKATEKVEIKVNENENRSSSYIASSFISLTKSDIATLQNKCIKAFRLYIYDQTIGDDYIFAPNDTITGKMDGGQKYKEFFNCLVSKK